ncbi:MAG: hypothetical protein U0V02_05010 [Anaerolineales bacterium]
MSEMNLPPEFEEKVRKAMDVPSASPEFVNKLKNELAGRPVKMKPRFVIKPAWAFAFVIVVIALIASAPAAVNALKKLFGYVPGVGLVDNSSGMRTLAEPAAVTRDGVTLTVTQALVYADHVQLVFEVSGIATENDGNYASDAAENFTAFCGAPDGDAKLRLPDGTIIERAFNTDKYPENIFAMKPAYETVIPADVMEMTMVLKCLPWARLGAVPENWEVPLKLQYVPAGTTIGEPVLDVTPSVSSAASDQGLNVTLDKVVPQDDLYSFYFIIAPEQANESVLAYFPASASMVDATGQKISLVYMQPFSGSHDVAEPWELQSVAKPSYGPYTLVLDSIATYYSEDGSHFFDVDLGSNPQVGQTWLINQTLHLAGTDVRVVSATMAERDLSMWGGAANTQGLVFTFEAVDGKTPFSLDIMDRDIDHIMNGSIFPISEGLINTSEQYVTGLFYEKGIPVGKLSIAVNGQTTMTNGHWEFQWASPDQTGEELLSASESISSAADSSGVTTELRRVVKTNDGYLFFVHMTMPEQNPDFRVIEPVDVSVTDSTGKVIKLNLDGPQVYSARADNLWQFSTTEQISDGLLKLVVDKAKVYYSKFNFETPPPDDVYQKLVKENSFIFDVGADPQVGQEWTLNQEFETGGYHGIVKSVRAVTVDSTMLPFPGLQADASINRGYEFTVEAVDPSIQWNVNLFVSKPEDDSEFADCIGGMDGEAGSVTTHIMSCRGLSSGNLQVEISEISIWLNEAWEVNWVMPGQ